jgi:hypothetical protein
MSEISGGAGMLCRTSNSRFEPEADIRNGPTVEVSCAQPISTGALAIAWRGSTGVSGDQGGTIAEAVN